MDFPTIRPAVEGVDDESINELIYKALERHTNQIGFNLSSLDDTDLSVDAPVTVLRIGGEPVRFKLFRLCLVEEDEMSVVLESDWSSTYDERYFVGLKGEFRPPHQAEKRYGKLKWTASDIVCLIPTMSERGERLCSDFYTQSNGSLFTFFGL